MLASPAPAVAPRALLMLVVLGLHLWLLGWLQREGRRAPPASAQQAAQAREPLSITVHLRPLPSTTKGRQDSRRESRPKASTNAPVQPRAKQPALLPQTQASLPSGNIPAAATQTAAVSSDAPAEPAPMAASAPLPRLLDSEATRRAVRQAAREAPPGLVQAQAENAQQRLERGIKNSADGDCLKGEFMGGGMGLLSAPFWLLAEARGKCRR